jgi:hypothetical protein
LYDHAQRANWIGCVWHNQFWHEPELDSSHSSRKLHDQQLHRIAERHFDWNPNWHIIRRERSGSFDLL